MEIGHGPSPLREFEHEDRVHSVNYQETVIVAEGVQCDVYSFATDPNKDLGVIRIDPGYHTPRQRVLRGDRTIEGYISGVGKLAITRSNGSKEVHEVGVTPDGQLTVDVAIGDVMQWQASEDSPLVVYEICYPPYQNGRYKNIE